MRLLKFQHTAARRRLGALILKPCPTAQFQHTAARRRLGPCPALSFAASPVSTHSRPKAAGKGKLLPLPASMFQHTAARRRLAQILFEQPGESRFQHTAARRRLGATNPVARNGVFVSTHSRPKAAGRGQGWAETFLIVSTHSRPKAAGKMICCPSTSQMVSTHSRPKAAGSVRNLGCTGRRFNTQPPEGGWDGLGNPALVAAMFQHTAARRRLENLTKKN